MVLRAPTSTLFPYTTLFRSRRRDGAPRRRGVPRLLLRRGHRGRRRRRRAGDPAGGDRKSTRLNSSHVETSYAVFCLKKKKTHGTRLAALLSAGVPRPRLRPV